MKFEYDDVNKITYIIIDRIRFEIQPLVYEWIKEYSKNPGVVSHILEYLSETLAKDLISTLNNSGVSDAEIFAHIQDINCPNYAYTFCQQVQNYLIVEIERKKVGRSLIKREEFLPL